MGGFGHAATYRTLSGSSGILVESTNYYRAKRSDDAEQEDNKDLLDAIGVAFAGTFVAAQELPSDYQQVMNIVGKQGDYKANVLKVLESEVQPTLKVLRAHGLDVVAIHHHMINSRPVIIFFHYWGRGQQRN